MTGQSETEPTASVGVPQRNQAFFARFLRRLGNNTFWPLADQAVVSAGNFLTLLIVARALPEKSDYGVFGLLLECIFYLNTIQSALIIYPLTVKGAIADAGYFRKLGTISLLLTLLVALPIGLIAMGIAVASQHVTLGLAAVFAMVAWQVQEVLRRSLIAQFRYAHAVLGDSLRYLGTTICLAILWQRHMLTLPNAFGVIGTWAALASVVQALQLGLSQINVRDLLDTSVGFWISGRWMLLTSVSALLNSLLGVWTLSWFHGNDTVGDFYAMANFTKPINPLLITFSGLVVQHAAKAFNDGGFDAAKRVALRFSGIACALILPYLLIILTVPSPSIRLFYGGQNHFDNPHSVLALRLLTAGFIVLTLTTLTGAFLNGIHRTRENFWSQIANSIATVAISFPLTIRYGLIGGLIGGIATLAVQLVAMMYFLRGPKRIPV